MASLLRLRPAITRAPRPSCTRSLQHNVVFSTRLPSSSFSTVQTDAQVDIPPDATTAGQVLQYLNTQCKDSLDNAHIQALAKTCTSPSDYPKLLHAITTFKRTRGYVMDSETAACIIDQVLKANPDNHTAGPLWILENFKVSTGLYYSATVYKLEDALDQLLVACENSGENEVDDADRVWKALENVTFKLIQRKTLQGARGMKKRAKREYLRCLQNKGGPTQHTVRRVAQIGVSVKGVDETVTAFIKPFQAANVSIHPKTMEWIEQLQNGGEEQDENKDENGSDEQETAEDEGDEPASTEADADEDEGEKKD